MIKWSLQKEFICIPRSSKRSRIKENFEIFDFRMATDDVQTLVSFECCFALHHNTVLFICAGKT
jgi:diketogulonate reductase-like aldo/keto reductase